MSVKKRIKDFCQSEGITISAFENNIGVSNGYVNAISKSIGIDKLNTIIEKYSNLNIEWLLTGKGAMLKTNYTSQPISVENIPLSETKDTNNTVITKTSEHENLQRFFHGSHKKSAGAIPLVSEKAVGGFVNEHFSICENDILDYYVIPKFRYLNVDFMIELTGDSMMPRLYPGDIIACSIINNSNFIQWNKPHLLATREQGLIVKRLRKSHDPNCLFAVSDNHEYDPIDIPKDEILGIARVVGVIHLE